MLPTQHIFLVYQRIIIIKKKTKTSK